MSASSASDPATGPGPEPHDPNADDSAFARALRRLDSRIGVIEQAVLLSLLAIVVSTSLLDVVLHQATGEGIENKSLIIKYGVFAIAMIGGAFATQQQRLLSLDLLSRFLAPKGKAALRITFALFAIGICALSIWGGLKVYEITSLEKSTGLLPPKAPATLIPLGFVLIALHLAIQVMIEVDYLRRGKAAPAPEGGAV